MFQDFEDRSEPALGPERIGALRAEMEKRGLAGFLVPRSDEHMGEYVPPSAERLRWLTGFSGSAGVAVILADKAALFVDGRYTIQAAAQVDTNVIEPLQTPENKSADWLKANLKKGDKLGYDPRLHTVNNVKRLTKAVQEAGADIVVLDSNPIDDIWPDRPEPPAAPVVPHPLNFAGEATSDKIQRIQEALRKAGAGAAVLTMPDSIAWLLNIRGGDVPHTPVALCFAIVHADAPPELFIDAAKLTSDTRGHLEGIALVQAPDTLAGRLAELGEKKVTVQLDPDTASVWFTQTLSVAGARIKRAPDPCILPKAIKNEHEIAGTRAAHRRDGAAMCRFLAWLDREAPAGTLDEITAASQLEALRADTGKLKEISFDTIAGAGANGAVVHYRVTHATNAPLEPGSLFLIDSGAQYQDGTTDITRTIAIGKPLPVMRRHATLVLKGHIAIATSRFPKGTRGADLDPFARRALWQAGLDFDHGTGHGVGSYLSVHEGPARISRLGNETLHAGMILSNEPGYYKRNEYGIRIENLVLVTAAEPVVSGDRDMMGFETLTLAPIDRRLIDAELLSPEERDWLNAYHARVLEEIAPELDEADAAWLAEATRPLGSI